MIFLADANLLIASALTNHVHHRQAREWFDAGPNFATTPITELAWLRVSTHKNYGLGFKEAMAVLETIQQLPNHIFWPADIPLTRELFMAPIPSGFSTEAYLLALAKKNSGKLATFDTGIKTIAKGSGVHLELLNT